MMSGVPLETCSAFDKRWNNKFYYGVASCWLFLQIQLLPLAYFYTKPYKWPLRPKRVAHEPNTVFQETVVVLDCVFN